MEYNYCEKQTDISLLLQELIQLFKHYFQQNWFFLLLEDIPGNRQEMYELTGFLSFKEISIHDKQKLQDIITFLDHFVSTLQQFLAPVLREKLRISGLSPDNQVKDRNERIRNGFIAAVFPDNLERISYISDELKLYLQQDLEKKLN
ncbi:MAG: hypothetical protein JXJ04_00290 [Spirochaetales bacterium]|nr:hypothetical protein [Spirochaetales bacterium]